MDEQIPENAIPIEINKFRTPASVWASEVAREGMSEERLQLYNLEKRLSTEIMRNRRRDSIPTREVDDMVAVQSLHHSSLWHRGKIEQRMEMQAGVRYRVFLVDQGITLRCKPDQMRSPPFKVEDVPHQAMIVILEGIVPMSLAYCADLDNFHSEISTGWTPSADHFVERIKNSYAKAYFVEKEGSPPGQIRYGDILILMKDDNRPASLAQLLCQEKYAKYNQVEFAKRQRLENIADAPEICESPLSYGYLTDTTDTCSSPVRSLMSSPKPKTPTRTMSEFVKAAGTPDKSTQPTEKETAPAEPAAVPPPAKGRLALFAQLKRSTSVSSTHSQASAASSESSTPSKDSCMPSAPVNNQSSSAETTSPKKLDARFVPAGRVIKKEMQRPPSSSSSFVKSSDSEDSFNSSSKRSMQSQNGHSNALKPTQNGFHREAKIKVVYNSDSSFSDNSMHGKGQEGSVPLVKCSKSSSNQSGWDSNDSTPQPLDKPSLSNLPGRMSLFAKLRKQEILPSSATDDSSSSESVVRKFTSVYQPPSDSSDNQINQHSPGVTRNLLLSSPKMSAIDADTSSQIYLARPVLLHGGFAPKPWVTHNDVKLKFSSSLEKYLLERRWCFNILTIEKYMWPAIQQRQNVVMISPKRSGKTSGYIIPIMDFMCSLEETPKGCGPLALILCSGSRSATKIYEECVKSVRNLKKPPQVQVTSGLVLDTQFIFKLINGCQVFITTPPCLLRILQKYSYAMNFHRLQHFILDEADIIMTRFLKEVKEIQAKVVAEQATRTEEDKDPIQIIVSSEKWEPHLLSFSEHLRGSPLLCINDNFESCVYGKPNVVFHLTQSNQKPTKLIQILRDLVGLQKVVVFCDASETSKIEEFIENACMNCLVVRPNIESRSLEAIRSSWNSSKAGGHYVLLCPDSEFDCLDITDANSVVHYSLPFEDKSFFVKRLSVILSNIPNKLEEKSLKPSAEKPHHLLPSIHLLMDESNTEQLPVIVQLMQRIAGRLDQKFLDIAKNISMNKEKKIKMNKLLCTNIKMFGECWNVTECSYRHVFVPGLDESHILPQSGVLSMQVVHVHCAGHFSVRLVEHVNLEKTKRKWPSEYVKIGMKMSLYFSKPANRMCVAEINVGDLFAVESEAGVFQRVQILEVLDKNKYGKPVLMLVQYLDEGHHDKIKEYMLHPLPEELKAFPPQVVDVFLCGLLPADQDSTYGADANGSVKKWTGLKSHNNAEASIQRLLQGQIMLSMTDSLWVDPVNILEWLPHTQEYVVRRNIKQSLLQEHYALPNSDHLPKLYSFCGKDPLSVSSIKAAVQCPIKPKEQCKASWAFLEADDFEEVEFISAESVSVFFVRRVKFQPLLDELIKDINSKDIPKKSEDVSLLTAGSICLAKYEDKWHRVRIQSQNEDNSLTVFYVDFGDAENVTQEEIKCIPDWAITRLPFQAIECSLAGVSTCDTVDKLYDVADGHSLLAKICKRKDAVLTSGNHYVVVILDCSNPNPSILNKDLLELDGVQDCKEEMGYLDFEIDENLLNRCKSMARAEAEVPVGQCDTLDEDPDFNLSDLEFKPEDLDSFMDEDTDDGLGNFEICNIDQLAESFKKENEAAVGELAQQMQASSLSQQPHPNTNSVQKNHAAHISKKGAAANVKQEDLQKKDDDSDWEEQEHDWVGRNILPVLCSARPPTTKWLEDLYYVWIKICITGVEKYFLQWTCDSFQFSTSVNGRNYHIDQHLRGAIVPTCVTSSVKGFSVEIKMRKACSGMFWERLLYPRRKFHWLTRDLEAIDINSSDSEAEDALKHLNKEIRKVPLKLRRRPLDKFERHQERKPDLESDSPDSNCEVEMLDSDEMF